MTSNGTDLEEAKVEMWDDNFQGLAESKQDIAGDEIVELTEEIAVEKGSPVVRSGLKAEDNMGLEEREG